MKRVTVIFFLCALPAVVALNSCTKGGAGGDDPGPHVIIWNDFVAPVLDVLTPTDAQVFSSGNAISISGKITDDQGLYQGTIKITKDSNGELVRQQLYEIHGVLTYNFNISETITVSVPTDYNVTVKFEDHGLNIATKTVKIKVNP